VLTNQLVRLRTMVEEAFGVTVPHVKITNNRFSRSWMGRVGRLKLVSTRANRLSAFDDCFSILTTTGAYLGVPVALDSLHFCSAPGSSNSKDAEKKHKGDTKEINYIIRILR